MSNLGTYDMDNQYDSMMEALEGLKKVGYTESFEISSNGLESMETGAVFQPHQLTITEFHRFEGSSNPDDMSILYAIEADNGAKGLVVDAFGTYADLQLGEFIKKIKFE